MEQLIDKMKTWKGEDPGVEIVKAPEDCGEGWAGPKEPHKVGLTERGARGDSTAAAVETGRGGVKTGFTGVVTILNAGDVGG